MNGMQLTHTQPNGKMPLKLTITIIIIALLLNGCAIDWWVGDGRGDWTLDLYGGYAISKINSREILLIHKENPNDTGGSIVIPNFFVTAYQLHEPYIYLEGISTQKMSATDEELERMALRYYVMNAINGDIIGPFDSFDGFLKHCNSIKMEISEAWQNID